MSVEDFEKQKQLLQFCTKIIKAEQERLNEAETISVSEARKKLRERLNSK